MESKKCCVRILLLIWGLLGILEGTRLYGAGEANSPNLAKLPYTFDFHAPAYHTPSLVFEESFPKVPEKKMMVYKVNEPNVTEASVRELAQKHFGIPSDGALSRSPRLGLYWLKTSTQLFLTNPSNGSFMFAKIKKKDSIAATAKNYPSKEECQVIAKKYLKARNLLPEDAYLRGIADNTGAFSLGVMSVGFGRKVGDYKSWGAGAQIIIHIGAGGEVVKVRKTWQELVPYKFYPIKSPEEALKELQDGKGVLDIDGNFEGKVYNITFRYYSSPQRQEYVQPIYYFDCNGSDGPFYGVVSAIRSEYLKPRVDVSSLPMVWIKCRNPQCRAEYQITLKEYFKFAESYLKEHPDSATPPSLVCKVCGNDSGYRAVKCEKCGLIFEAGWKGPDYYDRCPRCKFSKTEERMNKLQPRQ